MFGLFNSHKCEHVARGWRNGKPYVWMKHSVTDGIGRIHGDMYATCDKCGKEFLMCKTHIDYALRQLLAHPATREQVLKIIEEN